MRISPMVLGLCLLIFSMTVCAQAQKTEVEVDSADFHPNELRVDTTHVSNRSFSQTQVDALKADPDLNYSAPPTVGETLWDRFLEFLVKLINSLFRNTTFKGIGKTILYAIGLVALIYLILALLRVNAIALFRKRADVAASVEVLHENIHEMDFEALIQEATAKNEFKTATRLTFLYALKILSDHHLIDWSTGKTNFDYVQEIQRRDLKAGFAELSTYFEYAWYGNFKVTSAIFDRMHSAFKNWRTKVEV